MERIEGAIAEIEAELHSLDADRLDRAQARRLLRLFARGERLCAGATAVLARRVGDPQIVARESGTSVGKARAIVGLSQRLRDTPVLRAAVCGGEVSLDQATEIAKAETAAPGSAEALVEVATGEPFRVLRERARAAVLDDRRVGLSVRQRAARRGSHRITDLGLVHIEADLEPHVGAPMVDRLEAEAARLARADSSAPREHLLADAFVEVFGGTGGGRAGKPEVVVVVSHEVAERGWTAVKSGELCGIPRVGPIDPTAAKELAQDAFITGVVSDGKDLRQMRRWTRSIPPEIRLALRLGPPPRFDGPACVDCGNRFRLEFDHQIPVAEGGPTSLANLPTRCEPCHVKKTNRDRKRRRARVGEASAVRGPPIA